MKPQTGGGMERRTLLKGMATGVAGAIAAGELAADAATTKTEAIEQPRAEAAGFLDEHQRRTLTSLAELLVPGSVAAGVVTLIDKVAAVDGQRRQRDLLNAIARFDQLAQAQRGSRWIDVPAAAQVGLMRGVSEGPAAGRAPFSFLRTAVINAYLSTEAGMKEFDWTGRNAWRELPGCTHADPEHE